METTTDGHWEGKVDHGCASGAVAAESRLAASGMLVPVRFEDLYEQHFAFVWRSLRRLGVAPSRLDDAAQDVFLVVHRRLSDYKPDTSAKAWMFAIARRVASDHRRTERRRGGLLPLSDEAPSPTSSSPLEGAMKNEASDIVLGFLEGLDEDRRAAFALAELEQMSAPEIGAALDVNVSTVYSRLQSARKAFVEYVTAHHPDAIEGADE